MEHIFLRKRDLPTNPKTPLDYGCFLKIRRDPEIIKKHFGNLERLVTKDGKTGIYANEIMYTYNGTDLNKQIIPNPDKSILLPVSLRENGPKLTEDFVNDIIQNISIRVGNKIATFDRSTHNKVLRNTNKKFDDVKKEIMFAIKEVKKKYKKMGIHFEKDEKFSCSNLFNTNCFHLVNNISKTLKVYIDQNKERYVVDVAKFKKDKNRLTAKKIDYFKKLVREKLEDMIPSKEAFNWIVERKAELPEEKVSLTFEEDDIYDNPVSKKESIDDVAVITLDNFFIGHPKFERFIKKRISQQSKFDTIIVKRQNGINDLKMIDFEETLNVEKNGDMKFEANDGDQRYNYMNKHMYVNDKDLGRYKFIEFETDMQGRLLVFLKKVI